MLFDLQIFSGGVYPPSATSRTISFSISNSFGNNVVFLETKRKLKKEKKKKGNDTCNRKGEEELSKVGENQKPMRVLKLKGTFEI